MYGVCLCILYSHSYNPARLLVASYYRSSLEFRNTKFKLCFYNDAGVILQKQTCLKLEND